MSNIAGIFKADPTTKKPLPLYFSRIRAGFPSPAEDYIDKKLDLNERHVKHDAATFFVVVKGDSMIGAAILPGDILIVDCSLKAENNKIIVASINGEYTVKKLHKKGSKVFLLSEHPNYPPIEITEGMDFEIWGVVTGISRVF
jgi:DNA polymerase V